MINSGCLVLQRDYFFVPMSSERTFLTLSGYSHGAPQTTCSSAVQLANDFYGSASVFGEPSLTQNSVLFDERA